MSDTVARLLNGDTCVAVTGLIGPDGARRITHTELTGFVIHGTHFWGMSETVMLPNEELTLQPTVFVHSDCVPSLEPIIFNPVDSETGQEIAFGLNQDLNTDVQFKTSQDYELIWSSAAGDDPVVMAAAIAEARSFKAALRLGRDMWLLQRCVLPQFMVEARYFRISTPERRVPFFRTSDREKFELLLSDTSRAKVSSTTFQGGVVAFSDGRFIWFNAPSSGVWQNWQELRIYASKARSAVAGGKSWMEARSLS
jgi:hypothetical protein